MSDLLHDEVLVHGMSVVAARDHQYALPQHAQPHFVHMQPLCELAGWMCSEAGLCNSGCKAVTYTKLMQDLAITIPQHAQCSFAVVAKFQQTD